MGSPLSPIIADIVLQDLEKKALNIRLGFIVLSQIRGRRRFGGIFGTYAAHIKYFQ